MSDRPPPPNAGRGRPKGSKNRKTREVMYVCRAAVERPEYLRSLLRRLDSGKAPHMETVMWAYAYGKPKERVEVSGPDGGPVVFQRMTDAELAARAAALAAKLGGEK